MFVCSCATAGSPPTFENTFDVKALDLAEYANEDFLITPNAYGGDYVTLAYITVDGGNAAVNVTYDQINDFGGRVVSTLKCTMMFQDLPG